AVEVVSPVEGGTLFRLLLAAARPADKTVSQKRPQTKVAGGTVLLIEDEPAIRDVTCRLLASQGCSVLTAADGDEAVSSLREPAAEVRAVLMDWNLPGLSGEALVRQLRAVSASVPLFLMSGLNRCELSSRLEGLGVTGYLQKPFRL